MRGKLAILANPMSGRDVRRLAARATNMTHEAKRDLVARVAAGADAAGVAEILILKEPFRVSTGALEQMPLRARVTVVDVGVTNSAQDSVLAVRAFREAGCTALVTLGGDGTNRIVARTWPDVPLMPLSTGTNNVFPVLMEATAAGTAAGLVASGQIDAREVTKRCKLVHVRTKALHDVGVIDAVLLRRDHVGNFLPFDPERIAHIVLTRAEATAVGMSPIGGLMHTVSDADDYGLAIQCGTGKTLTVPISPGLFKTIRVQTPSVLPFGETVEFSGPGVIALDGDREIRLADDERARITVARDGPPVIDVVRAMQLASQRGLFVSE